MTDGLVYELICTRISHDLVGNIGVVSNVVEVLEEDDPDFCNEIKPILRTSSEILCARMKFFRMAFGLDNSTINDENLVKQIAQDYFTTSRKEEWLVKLSFGTISPEKRKNALLIVMIMSDILLRNANLAVFEENNRLIARAEASAKIASEKFEKIKNALQNSAFIADADLAPVFALKQRTLGQNIRLENDGTFIKLTLE